MVATDWIALFTGAVIPMIGMLIAIINKASREGKEKMDQLMTVQNMFISELAETKKHIEVIFNELKNQRRRIERIEDSGN